MITNYSRSYWFGASDVSKVMHGNEKTWSWQVWWAEKIGGEHNDFTNMYMRAGTMYEHPILDAINPKMNKDRQLFIPEYRMRINLDGDYDGWIYEVKTHKPDKEFYPKKASIEQCHVQAWAWEYCRTHPEKCWFDGELQKLKGVYLVSHPILDYEEVAVNPHLICKRKVKPSDGFMRKYLKRHIELVERLKYEER